MRIEAIPFNGRTVPGNAYNYFNRIDNFGYSAPLELPKPVRLFGQDIDYISIGRYCQILLGKWWMENRDIPDNWDGFNHGPLLLPFGERQFLRACGTAVNMWVTDDDVVVISINAKDHHRKAHFQYQIHFPLRTPNIVEYHYRNVQTGFNTLVGILGPDSEVAEWTEIKADFTYVKSALRFVLNESANQPEPTPEPVPTPTPQPTPTPTPQPTEKIWSTVYEGNGYRVQEQR